MRLVAFAAVLASLQWTATAASSSDGEKEPPLKPCTIRSKTTGYFFDLNKINVQPPEPGKKSSKDDRTTSWHARGYDYGANFTLNICGPVVENFTDIVGLEKKEFSSVAGFYERDGKTYSLGSNNSALTFRGRKLVLTYKDGSPCPSRSEKSARSEATLDQLSAAEDSLARRQSSSSRTKSTVISFLCERDPTQPDATVSFVDSPDDCTYVFEARSFAACPAVNVQKQSIGPGGVFGIIASIAILVYLIGGIVYQRTVMHQRGWRQLPNYALWSGMASFFTDMFVILTSSCTRCLPRRRRGYNQLDTTTNGFAGRNRGRQSDHEEENQLIDELDEEY